MLGLTAFWATVVKVELTDIVFAIDSILVAVAMSNKTWVILTGGILGIIAMRLVIGKLLALIQKYPALVDGAFVIIAWVGIKLLLEFAHQQGYVHFEIPKWLALGLIVVIFAIAFFYARKHPHVEVDEEEAAHRRRSARQQDLLCLSAPFELSQRAALALVGRVRALHARAVHPFDPAHFFFFLRQRGRGVLIEQPRLRFRQVPIGKAEHGDRLLAAERAAQPKLVADAELPMRLAALAVDLDLSALTRLLCLGARAIQARDVEPDVEANGGVRLRHRSDVSDLDAMLVT